MENNNMENTGELFKSPELSTPYVTAIRQESKDKISGHDRSLDIVFDEINKQAIENFSINKSKEFPGVEFSSIKLSITPDLIGKINNQGSGKEPSLGQGEQKRYAYFIQPAFGFPPAGNAFSALDVGIDRFIREIPKLAKAMRKGEAPPTIDIYILGSTSGFGGHITPEWLAKVKHEGFTAEGRLYAEFVEKHLPKDPTELARTVITLQGVSEGATISSETSKNLPKELKDKVHRLYDIPVGLHDRKFLIQALKTVNMAAGFGAEVLARTLGRDITSQSLSKTESQFYKDIKKAKNLPEDDKVQSHLKWKFAFAELAALAKGNPPDQSARTFIRTPEFDPVNFNAENFVKILKNSVTSKKKFLAVQKGRTLTFPTSRKAHFFVYKKSFKRWGQIMEFSEKNS